MANKPWYRIDLTIEQVAAGHATEISRILPRRHADAGAPEGVTIWLAREHPSQAIYISPVAAELIPDLLAQYNAVEIGRPDVNDLSLGYGINRDVAKEMAAGTF